MRNFFLWFVELLTDANNRPEIKAVIGVATIVVSFVWLFTEKDVIGFLTVFSSGGVLLGIKTAEDAKLDADRKAGK